MKDCKWNPPTAGSKGQLFDASGRPVERSMLDALADGDRTLKFLDDVADRKARRAAASQVKQWRKDGTYEKFLSGELDPPSGWTLHIRDAAADRGGPSHAVADALEALVPAPSWMNARRDTSSDEAAEISFALLMATQHFLPDLEAARAVFAPHLVSLERQGRITADDLRRFAARLAEHPGDPDRFTATVARLADALGSPALALELTVRHPDAAWILSPQEALFAKKVSLLRHATVNLAAGVAEPHVLLQYAASTGMSAARFDTFAKRSVDVAAASGLAPDVLATLSQDKPASIASNGDPSPLMLLSVLADPVDQRALGIVYATLEHTGWRTAVKGADPVALLAAEARNLPDGAGDLDRLVRAVAAGLRDGSISGTPTEAARAAAALLTGSPSAQAASVVRAAEWSYGTLGVLDTGKYAYPHDLSLDRALARTRSQVWDTVVLAPDASFQDHLLAAALCHERSTGAPIPDGFAARADALAAIDTKLRTLAQAAAIDGARSGTPSDGLIAAAVLADAVADRLDPSTAAPLVGEYLASTTLDTHRAVALSPTAQIITRLAADAALQDWPARPVFDDPHTEAAYRRGRAASADTLASPAEPFLDPRDAGAVLTVAHAPSTDAVALALRVEDALAAAGIQAVCKPRAGELAVTLDPDTGQARALEALFELFAPAS